MKKKIFTIADLVTTTKRKNCFYRSNVNLNLLPTSHCFKNHNILKYEIAHFSKDYDFSENVFFVYLVNVKMLSLKNSLVVSIPWMFESLSILTTCEIYPLIFLFIRYESLPGTWINSPEVTLKEWKISRCITPNDITSPRTKWSNDSRFGNKLTRKQV